MSQRSQQKVYSPTRQFDDQLTRLVQLFQDYGLSFSGVDAAQLARDAADQRTERADHDEAERAFADVHQAFRLAQEARFQRFSAALFAARGAFRGDKAMTAKLASLSPERRRHARRASPAGTPSPSTGASTNGSSVASLLAPAARVPG